MTDLRVTTIDGTDAILEEVAVQDLAAGLRARCCAPMTALTTRPAQSGTA